MAMADALRRQDADELFEGFFAVERELRSLLDERMSPFGLTYAQFMVLRFIQSPRDASGAPTHDPVHAKDIAEHFGFSPRTVTVAINVLVDEKKAFVTRRRSCVDRRSWDLLITAKGKSAFANANLAFGRACAGLSQMPETHRRALWYALPRLLESIDGQRRKGRLKKRQSVLHRMQRHKP